MRTVKTSAESFTSSLEKNKFSMREYFRYAGASTKTFGSLFKSEFDTINKVAEENVKRLQTQYIKLGRDSTGAMKAIAVMPTQLDLGDLSVKTQMAAQKQALFNQLVKQGSTNLLNFGKNTQWAGRQLMVGFTIPLTILGNTAAKSFMDMETAALKFRKVYGDLFTPAEETQQALDTVKALGESFTRYGIAVSSTVGLAADAAAAGFQGLDLQRQVTEATRLQVLGQVDQQKALETTISLQNAFQMSSEELSGAINFLNAVENQTVVSLDDITTAIPKAAPVVKQLGGDVKDLAFFMAAMKEGGINASEGANALKSGLASLINPTGKAKEMMMGFGIDIDKIVNKNAGNVKQTVIEFAQALDGLSDLNRQRAIEQLFGKFQLARLSTLFENVTKSGNQASRVLDLATASTEDLAAMAEKELGMTADSAMNKFRKSVEDLKLALVPVGQVFLETVTPILEFLGDALGKFNNLSSGAKKAITIITVAIGAIGPVALMTFGLLANALANGIKFISILRTGYLRLTGQSQVLGEQTQFLTVQQQEAAAVAHSLDQSHARLTQTFNAEKTSVNQLASAYANAARAASSLLLNNPGMVLPGRTPKKFSKGVVMVPGSGSGDTVPAMLEPGEAVIPKKMAKRYAGLIDGMIAGNIPGYQKGKGFKNATIYMPESMNTAMGQVGGPGVPMGQVLRYLQGAGDAAMAPLMAVMAREMKMGLNNPKFKSMWIEVGKELSGTVTGALADSGRVMVTDDTFEEIVVPALREKAKALQVAGKEVGTAMNNAIDQVRTVGPVGVGSGRAGSAGRVALPGSYRSARTAAQEYAASQNPEFFQKTTRFSQSRQKVMNTFQTFDPTLKKWEVGTMAHITKSITTTAEDLIQKVRPYLGDMGSKIIKAITKGTIDGVKQEAQIQSPSIKAKKAGQDIAKGGIAGIVAEVRNARAAGQQLGAAVTAGAAGGGAGGGGGNTTFLGMPGMGEPKGPGKFSSKLKNISAKFGAGKYAGAGFAASMGVSAAAMMPGPVGDVAQKAMPAIFGLQALQMALKLPIPHLKAVAGVALLAYGAFKLFNSAREKERLAIEGLGDAATLSSEKVKTLGEFFGVAPTQTKLERTGPSLILNQEKRSQVDQLRGTESFQKDFGKDIKSLKGASDAQAKLIFNSLAIQLKGKGFAKENIDTIVKALQEESGKTNIKFDFANIDLATERGRATLQRTATNLGNNFGKQFSEGYSAETKTGVNRATGEVITWTEEKVSKGLKKSVATTSKAIAGMFNGLSGQIENGSITAEQFNQSFEGISKTIEAMPEPQGMFLLDNILKNMPGDLAKTAVGIKNMSDKFLIAQAAMLGVATITPAMVKQLKAAADSSDSGAARAANRVRAKIKSDMKAVQEMFDIVKKEMEEIEGGKTGGTGEESPFTRLKKQLQEAINNARYSVIAFDKMRKAGVSVADALELSKDPLLAQVLATEKSKKNIDIILKLVKTMNTELQKDALSKFLKGLQGSNKISQDFLKLIPTLDKVGATSEDIATLLNDPKIAQGMIEGFNKARDKAAYLKTYIDELVKKRVLEIQINLSTTGGKGEAINAAAEGAIKTLDARAKLIRQAAEKGSAGADFSALTGVDPNKLVRKDGTKINLDASKKAVETAKAGVAAQQKAISGINDEISGKQRLIDINQGLIDAQQLEIDKINENIQLQEDLLKTKEKYIELNYDAPLKALSDENSLLSNYQAQIQYQQKAINEAYDKQQQAMEEMNRLNQQSIEQGKQKISIADALSQGDISAAAQAVQDLRAQEAAANAANTQSMFGAARQSALNNVTAGGMNSAQIEERQYQISQQSFKLEQDKAAYIKLNILPIQQEIVRLEESKIPFQNEINRITKINEGIQRDIENTQRTTLFNAEAALKIAEDAVTAAEEQLEADEKIVDEIIAQLEQAGLTKKEWEAILESTTAALDIYKSMTSSVEAQAAAAKAIADTFKDLAANPPKFTSYEDHFITNYITNIVTTQQAPSGGSGGTSDAAYDAKIGFDRSGDISSGGYGVGAFDRFKTFGGRINKYAMGGSVVPGEGLLDSVKALLTPGEFVVNKASAQAYAPLLEAINGQTYPMMNVGRATKNNKLTKNTPMQFDMPTFGAGNSGSGKTMMSSINVSQNQTSADNSSSVYNYDVSININGNDMDTEAVANTVLVKIKQLQDQQIKRRLK
jgi:TP901 family phage tail tape measure protein